MKYILYITLCLPVLLTAQSPETVTRYNDAVAAAKEKDHQKAIEIYGEVIEMDPLYSKAYLSRGSSHMKLKNYTEAVKNYGKCLKLEPENGKAHYYAGYCLMQMKKNEDAIKSFTRALKYDASLTKSYYYRAKIQMQAENYDKAIADFQDAITKDKATEKTYYNLGVCYLKKDNADLAKQSFNLALKQKEDFSAALGELTKMAYKADDFDEAIALAERFQAADPKSSKAPYYKGMSQMKSEQLDAAYASFNEVLEIDAKNKSALTNKASISLRQKNYETAVADYSALIAEHPAKKHYYNRALSQMRLEAWDKALSDLTLVIKEDGEYGEAFYNRSNVQLKLGDKDKACMDMQQAAKLGYTKATEYLLATCGS